MAEHEGRIAQLLREVAGEMPVDPGLERRTLRRSRRQRTFNASLAGITALVLIVGSFAGLRALTPGDPRIPLGDGPSPTGSPSAGPSTSSPEPPPGLPEPVAQTWSVIMSGVEERDFDALASVIDPMVFQHNAGDGSDPIPGWREDASILDAIPTVLSLDYVVRDFGGDYGTVYLWPYLVDADISDLTERERADLHALGFTDRDIDVMAEGAVGAGEPLYLGPRVGIRADGVWVSYITGGE